MASFLLEKGSKLSLFRCGDDNAQEHCFLACQVRTLIHKLDPVNPLQK